MPEPLLTKRLHISGLTSSITPADLERRLSSFGRVTAMDGFGARDALGDLRKFGFVTMEIGAKGLAKCLNVLSGSTWKGAKLRIGEAKPDFGERLAQFNSQPPRPVRQKRTRVRNYGYLSSTLPLTPLSATAAASIPGWIATPSGRVVRPMRMRPGRPLEPMRSESSVSRVKSVNGKAKKRVKLPPARARRRLIDPTKWDSVYLRGVFLDALSVPSFTPSDRPQPLGAVKRNIVDEGGEEVTEDSDSDAVSSVSRKETKPPQEVFWTSEDCRQLEEAALAVSSGIHEVTESSDVRDEAHAALAMLDVMFGDNEDWEGRESLSEMEHLEDIEWRGKEIQVDDQDDEIVLHDFEVGGGSKITEDKGKGREQSPRRASSGDGVGADLEVTRDTDVEMDAPHTMIEPPIQVAESAPQTNLKTLFAPREEASFSLLDRFDLDLDFDLDADILGLSAPSGALQDHPPETILPTPRAMQIPTTVSATKARSRVTLDPSLPLLFPPPDSLPHPYGSSSNISTTIHRGGTPACFLFPSPTRVRGLHHLQPSVTFTRSPEDTPESIRERWESDKSSLTHEWKKAWREARGSRRGRFGAGGEVAGGY